MKLALAGAALDIIHALGGTVDTSAAAPSSQVAAVRTASDDDARLFVTRHGGRDALARASHVGYGSAEVVTTYVGVSGRLCQVSGVLGPVFGWSAGPPGKQKQKRA